MGKVALGKNGYFINNYYIEFLANQTPVMHAPFWADAVTGNGSEADRAVY